MYLLKPFQLNFLKQNASKVSTDHFKIKKNATNNRNNKIKTKLSTQTTWPLIKNKRIVESAWAEVMGQFLYHLDPNTRKITRVEKLQ